MQKEIIRHSFVLVAGILLGKVLTFFYTPILARVLGPEGLGTMALVFAFAPWFIVLGSLMLDTAITKKITEYRAQKKPLAPLIKTHVLFSLVFGLLATGLFMGLAPFIAQVLYNDSTLTSLVFQAAPFVLGSILYVNLTGILRGLKRFAFFSLFEFTRQFILIALTLFLLLAIGLKAEGAVLGMALAPYPLILVFLYRLKGHVFNPAPIVPHEIVAIGGWLTLNELVNAFIPQLDKILLGAFAPREWVGWYAGAFTLAGATMFLGVSFKRVLLPYFSESNAKKDEKLLRYTLERSIVQLVLVLGFTMIGVVVLRGLLVNILYGPAFAPAIPLVGILVIVHLLNAVFLVLHVALQALNRMKYLIALHVLALGIGIALALYLVPLFYAAGAGMAMIGAYAVLLLGCYWKVRTLIHLPLRAIGKALGMVGFFIALAYAVPQFLEAQVFLGAVLAFSFIALAWHSGLVLSNDKQILLAMAVHPLKWVQDRLNSFKR
ncbi:MAG: oligosaccharide flippase family protein [Candidatus Diapherotrites archaeon]|nr:oligosaccharide flippase family protein [Candidatus Diapherotrites archaeon]